MAAWLLRSCIVATIGVSGVGGAPVPVLLGELFRCKYGLRGVAEVLVIRTVPLAEETRRMAQPGSARIAKSAVVLGTAE